jgi:hypothetical protein
VFVTTSHRDETLQSTPSAHAVHPGGVVTEKPKPSNPPPAGSDVGGAVVGGSDDLVGEADDSLVDGSPVVGGVGSSEGCWAHPAHATTPIRNTVVRFRTESS